MMLALLIGISCILPALIGVGMELLGIDTREKKQAYLWTVCFSILFTFFIGTVIEVDSENFSEISCRVLPAIIYIIEIAFASLLVQCSINILFNISFQIRRYFGIFIGLLGLGLVVGALFNNIILSVF
jgi:hypothetical protein